MHLAFDNNDKLVLIESLETINVVYLHQRTRGNKEDH